MPSQQQSALSIACKKIAQATRCVSFSGAGLSAESGIATFRGDEDDSLWSQYDPATLASQHGFQSDPQLVTDWYAWRRQTLAGATPNPAHRALAAQPHWMHVTQNVDGLLEAAGAPHERVLHLHGSLSSDLCNARCGFETTIELGAAAQLRCCPKCGAYLRPAVVWFGEALPADVFDAAIRATQQADLFLVVGTSATVSPAAGLIDLARQSGATVIVVNTEPSSVRSDFHRNDNHDHQHQHQHQHTHNRMDIELVGEAGIILPQLFSC